MSKVCKVEGCEIIPNNHAAKGYCHNHYNRYMKYGDPLIYARNFNPSSEKALHKKLKMRCKYGHLLAGTNLRITKKIRRGREIYERVCRECHDIHVKESRARLATPNTDKGKDGV